MAKRKTKSKTKGKKAKSSAGQTFLTLVSACAVALCLVSVSYGFFARHAGPDPDEAPFRLEVLNGTGMAGLAGDVAAALRRRGIDVFKVENADNFDYEESILIKRRAGVDSDALAREVGCENVVEQLKRDAFVDATLIVGADYAKLRLGAPSDSGLLE